MGGRGEWSPNARAKHAAPKSPEHKTVYEKRGRYEFEYDEAKSASNKIKHGISIKEAQKLWDDRNGIFTETAYATEQRYVRIAKMDEKHYTTIFTKREDSIRLISVRRARESEVSRYETKNH